MNRFFNTLKTRRGRAIAIALAIALLVAVPASARLIEIGETGSYPVPACPDAKNCRVVAQISGYQIQIGEKKNPFRVTQAGRLVAFTVNLPQNTKEEIDFFNQNRGGPPSAQISVLRPRPRRGVKYRYVLAGQSEVFQVQRYLGSNPTFPLKQSLTVKKNDVVAISTDTWLPAFSTVVDNTNVWRASRSSKKCKDVVTPSAHTKVGEIRAYGCGYKAARLLYHATIITNPPTTSK